MIRELKKRRRVYTALEACELLPTLLCTYLSDLTSHKFHKISDGCTCVREIVCESESRKDIVCLIHDWLYYTGKLSKAKADLCLLLGYASLGFPIVGFVRYMYFFLGGGFKSWKMHRLLIGLLKS